MTKTATVSSRSPYTFAVGNLILEEDAQEAAEMLNAAAGQTKTTYFSLIVGSDTWWGGGTGELGTHFLDFTNTSFERVLEGDAYIDPDEQVLSFEASVVNPATTTSEVRLTIGASTVLLTPFPAAADTLLIDDVATSATGTGDVAWFIEVRRLSGSGTCQLRNVMVESVAIAATDLPDPVNS